MADKNFRALGNFLGGGNHPNEIVAEAQGENLGANTQAAIAKAKQTLDENAARAQYHDQARAYIKDPAEADFVSGAQLSGFNPEQGMQAHLGAQKFSNLGKVADTTLPENTRAGALLAADPASRGPINVSGAGEVSTDSFNPEAGAKLTDAGRLLAPAKVALQTAQTKAALADAALHNEEAKNHPHIGNVDENGMIKPPAGFQWAYGPDGKPILDESGRPTQVPITGGGKDPNAPATMGSREAAMFARVLNSASLGTAALRNIARAPVGANAGVFGVGAAPGHSALASTIDTLRNKLSPEEVQQYMTMNTGLSRNLASVEGGGLLQPGQFSDQIGAGTTLRAGDAEETKLMRLAETRQILETGLATALANPRVPKSQKDLMRQHIVELQHSIPFTVEDVQSLKSQPAGSAVTLQDLITERGLRKPADVASAPGAPLPSAATGDAAPMSLDAYLKSVGH